MSQRTVAFFGASVGCGRAALKHTLAAGNQCVALCRDPSKLTTVFPLEKNSNLRVLQGNAHDVEAVSQCLRREDGTLVDSIVFSIGAKLVSKTSLAMDDPDVCKKGISAVLSALSQLRKAGATGRPHIIVVSTTGLSDFGRDLPFAMIPVYKALGKVPHADKKVMEQTLIDSGETYTIVRASRLVDGETDKNIRVGVEDAKTGRESSAIGYSISREDTGKWIAKNLVLDGGARFANKIATVTY
ncbi:NAD(P)-binding protein [Thozetella sp. PMI_491]|nr:NAD(P)-binding protein [Thozetella sp. PMI_491]